MNYLYPRNKILKKLAQSKYFKNHFERKYYSNFYSNAKDEIPTKGNILMYVGIGHFFCTPVEIAIYHLLKSRGYKVDFLIYDNSITANEVITKERVENEGITKFWDRSVSTAENILRSAKVNFEHISQHPLATKIVSGLEDDIDKIIAFKYEKICFGNIVEGVMYRYYKSLFFDDDKVEVAKRFLTTALTNYFTIKEKVKTTTYKYVMFSHGIYCTWQPIVEFCHIKGLPFVCYDRAKTKSCCNFNMNIPSPIWDISAAWKKEKSKPITELEEKMVDQYLKDRILQKNDVYSYNFSEKEKDLTALKKKLNIKPGYRVITIFTNLIWDAANVARDIAFESPLDCIRQTINKYRNSSTVHVLIRSHPAEKVLGTKERYGNLIRNMFVELPRNLTIIEAEANINSFSVLDITDIGVTHTSTVGLELAIAGKPSILISDTHYREKGFTYDVTSSKQYFTLIEKLLVKSDLRIDQQSLAKKYFYVMMFKYQHRMPIEFDSKQIFDGYSYESFVDLQNDYECAINKIVDRLDSHSIAEDFIFN